MLCWVWSEMYISIPKQFINFLNCVIYEIYRFLKFLLLHNVNVIPILLNLKQIQIQNQKISFFRDTPVNTLYEKQIQTCTNLHADHRPYGFWKIHLSLMRVRVIMYLLHVKLTGVSFQLVEWSMRYILVYL